MKRYSITVALILLLSACNGLDPTAAPLDSVNAAVPDAVALPDPQSKSAALVAPIVPTPTATPTPTIEATAEGRGVKIQGRLSPGDEINTMYLNLVISPLHSNDELEAAFVLVIVSTNSVTDEVVCNETVNNMELFCDIPYGLLQSMQIKVTDAKKSGWCIMNVEPEQKSSRIYEWCAF